MSSEIHAAGEREVHVSKGFRCRLGILTEREGVEAERLGEPAVPADPLVTRNG